MHDLERFNFVAETPTLKKGGQYEIVSTLRVNKLGRFEMSVFSGKHRQRLASTTKETAMTTAKYASEVGVDFISFGVPAFWDKDAELAQRITDERFQAVIKANPNAKIIVRLGLEPPKWWLESHKDDLLCSPDGTPIERIYVKFPSPSSEAYRRDAMEAMKKFINYVESKYPDNIAGYHPSGGGTSEWYYGDVYGAGYHGYDKATQKAWRKWLAKKYVTDEALQKGVEPPLGQNLGSRRPHITRTLHRRKLDSRSQDARECRRLQSVPAKRNVRHDIARGQNNPRNRAAKTPFRRILRIQHNIFQDAEWAGLFRTLCVRESVKISRHRHFHGTLGLL